MTSTCPPADALSALIDDALPPAARDKVLAHSANTLLQLGVEGLAIALS